MRAIVDSGPVVAYLYVLPPENLAALYYYDSAFGRKCLLQRVPCM